LLFHFHIFELSFRFAYLLLSYTLSLALIYTHKFTLFHLFSPYHFIYTYLSEALFSLFLLSTLLALLLIIPSIFYHLYQYLNPGLFTTESKTLRNYATLFLSIIYLSQLFFFFIFLPLSTHLILALNTSPWLEFTPKISEFISSLFYLSFFSFILFFFSTIFLLILIRYPNLFFTFSKTRPLFYFFLCCILSLLTPPDLFLFLGIFLVVFSLIEFLIFCFAICSHLYK
jgi:sec-independent protein translocase protein TatC